MSVVERKSRETEIRLSLDLHPGSSSVDIPCGFLAHMLALLAHAGRWTIALRASGDIHVDAHHLTEDIGIALGQALLAEMREGRSRERYGWCALPMDGTLLLAAVDLSGRASCTWDGVFPASKCGDFDTELVPEFWRAFAREARCTLHFRALSIDNAHHLAEASFKGMGRALRQALAEASDEPSSKGVWL